MAMIHIDYETRSAADLKTLGVWAYAAHPTTSVLTAFLESDEGWRVFWTPVHCAGWAPPAGMEYRWGYEWLAQLFHAGNIFVAHNAEFERAMSEVNLHLPEVTWIDTMALADYLALPGGLDDLAKHLYGVGKDKAGYQLMMRMCKPSARYGDPNNHGFVPFTPESLTAYALYNARDVDLAKRFYDGHHRDWDDCEEPVYHWHQAVNKRGLRIDTDAAAGLRDICLQIAERAGATVTQATMHYAINGTSMRLVGSDLTRVAHLTRWFNVVGAMHGGWSIDSCDEETLTTMLAQPLDVVPPVARAVAEARLSVSLASIKKVDAALNQISGDGRLRGQYRVYGAHTHRWTGRGMQPQNLPRPLPWLEEEALNKPQRPQAELVTLLLDACRSRDLGTFAQAHAAVEAYAKSKTDGKAVVGVNECLTSLIRPLIIPADGHKLIGADFAQIEGRVAAWMSGDRAAIKAFEDNDAGRGPDVYCVMASAIFGRTITKKDKNERQAGKAAELMCIAEGSPVLTDRGLVPIEQVRISDRVWDGVAWVEHAGVVCNGERDVITYDGLTATEDHYVFTAEGEVAPFGAVAAQGQRLLRPAAGGAALRAVGSYLDGAAPGWPQLARAVPLPRVRVNPVGRLEQHGFRQEQGLFVPVEQRAALSLVVEEGTSRLLCGSAQALYRPASPAVSELRRAGHPVRVSLNSRGGRARGADARASAAWVRVGSEGQRRGVCPGESTVCDASRAVRQPPLHHLDDLSRGARSASGRTQPLFAPPHDVLRQAGAHCRGNLGESAPVGRGASQAMASHAGTVVRSGAPVRVYDIVNAGPRHRFTVSGCLVHNCTYGGGSRLLDERHHDDFVRAGVPAEFVVNKWRELHRPTARYWRVLETAMRDAIAGRRGGSRFEAGPVVYERGRNGEVLLRFPSGRTMRYYDAQIESDDEYEGRTSIVYNSYKKGGGKNDRAGKIHLWGGHLLENGDQSLSRDLLTSAALRIEAHGIRAVMHTHDELVFEVPDAQVAEAAEIVRREMATPPAWAPGLPIKGDPAVMIRYNKDA